jgi:hypothetical protein
MVKLADAHPGRVAYQERLPVADKPAHVGGRRLRARTMLLGISETLRQYLLGTIPDTTVKIGAVGDLQAAPAEKSLPIHPVQ